LNLIERNGEGYGSGIEDLADPKGRNIEKFRKYRDINMIIQYQILLYLSYFLKIKALFKSVRFSFSIRKALLYRIIEPAGSSNQ